MKPTIIPTAPALRAQRTPRRIGWLVLTVTLSLLAGSVGALFTLSLPDRWSSAQRWLELSSGEVVVIPPAEDTGTAALLSAIQNRQFDAIVNLTVAKTDRGIGMIVSNDGWLVSPQTDFVPTDEITITLASGKTVVADELIVDDYADVSFIHIPKNNLPIVDLRGQLVSVGDAVLVVQPAITNDRRVLAWAAHLQTVAEPVNAEFSTQHNNWLYRSDRSLTGARVGAVVFDYHAQVLGLMRDEQSIIPITALESRLQQLLQTGNLPITPLAITYTLSDQGATITSSNYRDIAVDDVITEVENQTVNLEHDLSWMLQDYFDQTITISLTRDRERKTVRLEPERID